MDAMSYLLKVEERAKELYAASDQGPWEALPGWMQRMWINRADQLIKEENDGKRA